MTTTAREIAKSLTLDKLATPLPDGVYGTFVMADGVRYERCAAQVQGDVRWDRWEGNYRPATVCSNPTDGGRFCGEHAR